jgi:hypothetical protein
MSVMEEEMTEPETTDDTATQGFADALSDEALDRTTECRLISWPCHPAR